MLAVVLDTNILIAAAYNASSASRQIIDAALRDRLAVIVSPALQREYERILTRAVRRQDYQAQLRELIQKARSVVPAETPRVVPEDPDDDKLVAVADAAGADAIVTNDHHLLLLDPRGDFAIMRPGLFVERYLDCEAHGEYPLQ